MPADPALPYETYSLTVSRLSAGYGRHMVLKDISFQTRPGELTGLLGPNGCGKTTLLRALCGQLPYSGSCLLNGRPLEGLSSRKLARLISYIPQRSGIGISLPVIDVVLMGFNPVLGLLQQPSSRQREQAYNALDAVGMKPYAEHDYQKLSEGQKQLCILARTMVEDASLLLLDEPESSLDFPHRHQTMRLLTEIVQGRNPQKTTARNPIPQDNLPRDNLSQDTILLGKLLQDKLPRDNPSQDNLPPGKPTQDSPPPDKIPGETVSSPKTALITLHDPLLALEYCSRLILLKDDVCRSVLHPASDPIPQMETALSEIYGPIRLHDLGANSKDGGRRRLVILPE